MTDEPSFSDAKVTLRRSNRAKWHAEARMTNATVDVTIELIATASGRTAQEALAAVMEELGSMAIACQGSPS